MNNSVDARKKHGTMNVLSCLRTTVMQSVYVCLTCDVEDSLACPYDRDSLSAFCEASLEAGFPPTLFLTTDLDVESAVFFKRLQARGVSLGMHLHPDTTRHHPGGLPRHRGLGAYSAAEQRILLQAALADFRSWLGFHPLVFRPGWCSVSYATLPILAEIGFIGGSISMPGRDMPEIPAVWTGAPRHVHAVGSGVPSAEGALSFVNVPITVDYEDAPRRCRDLRLENHADATPVLAGWKRELLHQAAIRAPLRHVCALTHSHIDYRPGTMADSSNRRKTLLGVLRGIQDIAAELGLTVQGATIETVIAAFNAIKSSTPGKEFPCHA